MRWTLLICLTAISPWLTGCGKEARRDATSLCQVLDKNQSAYQISNGMERDLVASARGWVETITTGGAGRGAELSQNAGIARELGHSADLISTQLGELRKAMYDQQLKSEEIQAVRTTVNEQISKRQRFLQEFRIVLQDAAAQFDGFSQSRAYKGDSYPAAIDRLAQVLQAYHSPEDAVREAIQGLKTGYGITLTGGGV